MTTNSLTTTQAALWQLGDSLGLSAAYTATTRSPDDAIRAQFKTDRGIRGTRPWAICVAMSLRGSLPPDADCAEAILILTR